MKKKLIILSEQKSYIKKGSSAPQVDGQERAFLKYGNGDVEIVYKNIVLKNINRVLRKLHLPLICDPFTKKKYDVAYSIGIRPQKFFSTIFPRILWKLVLGIFIMQFVQSRCSPRTRTVPQAQQVGGEKSENKSPVSCCMVFSQLMALVGQQPLYQLQIVSMSVDVAIVNALMVD